CGDGAAIKWPNDVLIDRGKVCGILIEARPADGWAVLGIGLNVAVRLEDMPEELRATAATLGRSPDEVEDVLAALLARLEACLTAPAAQILAAYRERDALAGREVEWASGRGRATGVDDDGRLVVETGAERIALDAGEVHLTVR